MELDRAEQVLERAEEFMDDNEKLSEYVIELEQRVDNMKFDFDKRLVALEGGNDRCDDVDKALEDLEGCVDLLRNNIVAPPLTMSLKLGVEMLVDQHQDALKRVDELEKAIQTQRDAYSYLVGATVVYLKTEDIYEIVSHCLLEDSGQRAYVYRSAATGATWVRVKEEMEDGRFMLLEDYRK